VGKTDKVIRVIPAKNFASKIPKSLIGLVNKSSMVPVRRSSAMDRIVIAGIKIKNT
jgi:hypothetical protein